MKFRFMEQRATIFDRNEFRYYYYPTYWRTKAVFEEEPIKQAFLSKQATKAERLIELWEEKKRRAERRFIR